MLQPPAPWCNLKALVPDEYCLSTPHKCCLCNDSKKGLEVGWLEWVPGGLVHPAEGHSLGQQEQTHSPDDREANVVGAQTPRQIADRYGI